MSSDEKKMEAIVPAEIATCHNLNPYMKYEYTEKHIVINNPWMDKSVNLMIPRNDASIISSLNSIILPPVFSAIYHAKDKTFEFIFTLLEEESHYWQREFEFLWQGETIKCTYGSSSKELLDVARIASPTGSETDSKHRNLRMFSDFTKLPNQPDFLKKYFVGKKPISFYVGPISPPTQDSVTEFARHVNFYMSYYDRNSPQIIIHRLEEEISEKKDKELFPVKFPEHIVGSKIDAYMLDLWFGATGATGRLRYLYYYQILEYAAFYYLDEQVKNRVTRLLKRPDLRHAIDTCLPLILEEVVEFKQSDEQKITSVIQRTVDPKKIWAVIENNIDLFSKEQCFEGGYCVAPVIKNGWTAEDFEKAWIPKIPDLLRKVRNSLVHSRESRMGQFIAPTKSNNKLLTPWVKLIEEVAYDVMIYNEIL